MGLEQGYSIMDGSRLEILRIINEHPHTTVNDIAESLGLAPISVRYHLNLLERDGLIGIVDDHAIVRNGLRQFLSDHVDLRVIGEAASGRGATRAWWCTCRPGEAGRRAR